MPQRGGTHAAPPAPPRSEFLEMLVANPIRRGARAIRGHSESRWTQIQNATLDDVDSTRTLSSHFEVTEQPNLREGSVKALEEALKI